MSGSLQASHSVTEHLLVLQGGYSYSGQRCTAVKVVLVAEEIADELVAKVKKGVEGLSVGMPEVRALHSASGMASLWHARLHASVFRIDRMVHQPLHMLREHPISCRLSVPRDN